MIVREPSEPLDIERVRIRAYFLWENQTGKAWWDPVSNWTEAEKKEARIGIAEMPRPTLPYIVVDQNFLRDQSLIERLLRRSEIENKCILLPDSGLAEMLKGGKWDYAMKRSLEHLSKNPYRVVLAHSLGPLMKTEEATGELADDIVDREVTAQFRRLLVELDSGSAGEVYSELLNRISNAQQHANSQHFDHTQNKTTVRNFVDGWKEDLTSEELSALRSASGGRAEFIKMMASDSLAKTCAMSLAAGGYEQKTSERLAVMPSVSGMVTLLLAGLALKWLVAGGLDAADEAKLTNDLVDLDYVLFGVLSGELHSKEKRVMELFQDMIQVSEERWSRIKELLLESLDSKQT